MVLGPARRALALLSASALVTGVLAAVAVAPAGAAAPVAPLDFDAGPQHTLVIGPDHMPYGTGDNNAGELTAPAPGDFVRYRLEPLAGLPAGVTATDVAAGDQFSLVLGSDGIVYGAGANFNKQLGPGTTASPNAFHTLTPVTAGTPTGVHFTSVAATRRTSFATASDGNVYGIGQNASGLLGPLVTSDVPAWTLLPRSAGLAASAKPVEVDAGFLHVVVRYSNGVVVGEGNNDFGQLGGTTPGSPADETALRLLPPLPSGVTVVDVGAGATSTVLVGSDGKAYGLGDDGQGQLAQPLPPPPPGGGSPAEPFLRTPTVMTLPAGVSAVSADVGLLAGLVVGSDGVLYGSGKNSHGQLGTRPEGPTYALAPVQRLSTTGSVRTVHATDFATVAATDAGTVLGAGRNQDGLLTGNDGSNVTALRELTGLPASTPPAVVRPLRWTATKPRITGTARQGKRLTLTRAARTGFSPAASSLTYQWLRNGKVIRGATRKTYTAKKADVGKKLTVRLTGKRSGYKPGTVVSTATVKVTKKR